MWRRKKDGITTCLLPPSRRQMTFRPPPISDGASARASVVHLLSRAYSLPCSTAVQAFLQLVQPTSRFQLALDVLLPLLDDGPGAPELHLTQRILVSFLLYSLYAPHPISINPFKSVLFVTLGLLVLYTVETVRPPTGVDIKLRIVSEGDCCLTRHIVPTHLVSAAT